MGPRATTTLAWGLCALSLTLTVLGLVLLALNLSQPNARIYDTWLDNTLNAVFYSTVGALVASRDPRTPWAGSCAYLLSAKASSTLVPSTPSMPCWHTRTRCQQAKRWPGPLTGFCPS